MKFLALTLTIAAVGTGCGESETSESPEELTKHQQEIYDQQRGVCKTEEKFNTIEYRKQNGASDPERYAEYAAEHGFYLVRDDGERQAAIDGCLAGLP